MGYFGEGLFWRRVILGMGYLGWVILEKGYFEDGLFWRWVLLKMGYLGDGLFRRWVI